MDGCLVFPMVVNGSCVGSQEKFGFYIGRILCFCNEHMFRTDTQLVRLCIGMPVT